MGLGPEIKNAQLQEILISYELDDDASFSLIPSGHIHYSYKLEIGGNAYLLQQLNTDVFPDTQSIFDNVIQVQNKLEAALKDEYPYRWFLTKDQHPFIDLADGTRWRLMHFIDQSVTHQTCSSNHIAQEAGRILGQMHKYTYNIAIDTLHEIIPNFHDISMRIQQLEDAVKNNPVNRLKEVMDQLYFVMDQQDQWLKLNQDIRNGNILKHATHNDPKLENILFDLHGKAICLIDLDTVMAGCYLFDLGDLLRSCCTPYPEDDPNGSSDAFNLEYYTEIVNAYASETKSLLHETEWRSLLYSGLYMTFIMGVRFLTDYINGDTYYHIAHERQNLHRHLNQINLYKRMQEQLPKMESILNHLFTD